MVKCKKCGEISDDVGVVELIRQTVQGRFFDKEFSFEDIDIIDTNYIDTEIFYCFNCHAESKDPESLFEYIDFETIIAKYEEIGFKYGNDNYYLCIYEDGRYSYDYNINLSGVGVKYYKLTDIKTMVKELNNLYGR